MTNETAERLMEHHRSCGGFEYTVGTVQRDEETGERFYRYRCLKCQWEHREPLPVADTNAPIKQAA